MISFAEKYAEPQTCRQYALMAAYLLCGFRRVEAIGPFHKIRTAEKIFGKREVATALGEVHEALVGLSYAGIGSPTDGLPGALCLILLRNGSPYLEDITVDTLLQAQREWLPGALRQDVVKISKALQNLRAVILSRGAVLEIPIREMKSADQQTGQSVLSGDLTLEGHERAHILHTLEETDWVVGGPGGAAARLGMKRTTLQARMQKLGISRHR